MAPVPLISSGLTSSQVLPTSGPSLAPRWAGRPAVQGIGHPCSGGFRAVEGGLGIGGSPTGIVVGHVYYFLEDVFPNQPGGKRLLLTPSFL